MHLHGNTVPRRFNWLVTGQTEHLYPRLNVVCHFLYPSASRFVFNDVITYVLLLSKAAGCLSRARIAMGSDLPGEGKKR